MTETIGHLNRAGYAKPVCIGVHGIFAGDAYAGLKSANVADIVTCNTVDHPSNAIDITNVLVDGVIRLLKSNANESGVQEKSS